MIYKHSLPCGHILLFCWFSKIYVFIFLINQSSYQSTRSLNKYISRFSQHIWQFTLDCFETPLHQLPWRCSLDANPLSYGGGGGINLPTGIINCNFLCGKHVIFTAAARWAEVVIWSKSYIFMCLCVCARHFYQKPIQTARTTRVVSRMARRVRIVIRE